MLSVNIGPFIFTPFMLAFVAAFIVALFVGWLFSRGKDTTVEPSLSVMLLVGLAVARLAFVAQYLGDYASAPWRIFDIRDGGFIGEAGIAAALVAGAYSAFKEPLLRPALGAAIASGVLVWGTGAVLFKTLGSEPTGIAALPLNTLQRESFSYSSVGKPIVANLWATWCPPCRREMPVLANAQAREKGIDFIFVNQGESAESVRAYLEQQAFKLDQVYLDEQGEWASQMGAAGMPTTLFFDKSGNLVGSHTGELSKESLKHALKRYFR
jgi:thiol-disulfide isomerase/thioredoxin